MFSALIRHEARLEGRRLLAMAGIIAVVYALGCVLAVTRLPLLGSLGGIAAYGAPVALAAVVPALLLVRYYRALYSREGYLTMALPVRAGTLYAARFVWAYVLWLLALVLAALGFLGATACTDPAGPAHGWRAAGEILHRLPGGWWLALIIGTLLLSLAGAVAQAGWVVTFGMEERFRSLGLGGPVIAFVLVYLVQQVLGFVVIMGVPWVYNLATHRVETLWLMGEIARAHGHYHSEGIMPLGVALPLLLIPAILIPWTVRSIRRHTSLR